MESWQDVRHSLALTCVLAACTNTGSSADDPIDNAPYPACTAAAQQCRDEFALGARTLPIYRNVSLVEPNPAITQAVIVVHGADRDANNFFYSVMTAAEQDGVDGQTAVVAPHFQCSADHPGGGEAYWSCDDSGSNYDWAHGGSDLGDPSAVSSYTAMDQLISAFANKAMFPNLQRIALTGFSAGGQFVDRYASTTSHDPLAGVALSYAPISPSSYLWLDSSRPASTTGCAYFDDYPFGMELRSGYVGVPSEQTIIAQTIARNVTYLVGGEDTLANAAGTDMDTSCEANAQGIDRLARAMGFSTSLAAHGGTQPLVVIPGCMHSRSCVYFAPETRDLLFGK